MSHDDVISVMPSLLTRITGSGWQRLSHTTSGFQNQCIIVSVIRRRCSPWCESVPHKPIKAIKQPHFDKTMHIRKRNEWMYACYLYIIQICLLKINILSILHCKYLKTHRKWLNMNLVRYITMELLLEYTICCICVSPPYLSCHTFVRVGSDKYPFILFH